MIEALQTDRLRLRPLTIDDVDELVAIDSDPEVMRYLTGGSPSPRAEVEVVVRASIGHRWLAYESGLADCIGWFEILADGELGYRLRRTAWGSGLATEGTRIVIATAFAELGMSRVWAQTMAVNVASRRVMEKCGLRYVRTFHLEWEAPIDGAEAGEVEYELLKSGWEGSRPD